MFRMTKAQALAIQAEHVAHYSKSYPNVGALVAAATTADALPDGEHDVVVINRHIPRGGAIEALIPEICAREDVHREAIRAMVRADQPRKTIA